MIQYQTEAILLAVRDWSDADRMATLFSRQYGKIHAVAYGARRPRNSLAGSVQVFAHVEVVLSSGKVSDAIRQCEIKTSFRKIREDLFAMAYASFLAELVAELWPEREAEPKVFDVLLFAFKLMTERNPRLVALVCAWQLLSLAGYHTQYQKCAACGNDLTFPAIFDAQAGGGLCSACLQINRSNHLTTINDFTEDTALFIERILHVDMQNPDHFTVNKTTLIRVEKILTVFLTYILDKPLKSMSFIKHVAAI